MDRSKPIQKESETCRKCKEALLRMKVGCRSADGDICTESPEAVRFFICEK